MKARIFFNTLALFFNLAISSSVHAVLPQSLVCVVESHRSLEEVRTELRSHPDVDFNDRAQDGLGIDGYSLLHIATLSWNVLINGSTEILDMLVNEHHVNIQTLGNDGRTALDVAKDRNAPQSVIDALVRLGAH